MGFSLCFCEMTFSGVTIINVLIFLDWFDRKPRI